MDPLFFLGLSILLVAASLTAVLVTLIPAVQELARAARSAEKLFDTLRRELPPTLEAIRLTGMEISDLTDDVSESVKSAGQVVKRVDQGLDGAKKQAQKVQTTTRSMLAGMKAAWGSLTGAPAARRSAGRLSGSTKGPLEPRLESRNYAALPEESMVEEGQILDPHLAATSPTEEGRRSRESASDPATDSYITSDEGHD